MNKNSKTLEAIWVALNSISQRMYSKKRDEGMSLLINQNMDYIVDQISRRISCSCKSFILMCCYLFMFLHIYRPIPQSSFHFQCVTAAHGRILPPLPGRHAESNLPKPREERKDHDPAVHFHPTRHC